MRKTPDGRVLFLVKLQALAPYVVKYFKQVKKGTVSLQY